MDLLEVHQHHRDRYEDERSGAVRHRENQERQRQSQHRAYDQYQDLDEAGLGALLWVLIAIGVAALAIILFLIRWLLKRRKEEEEADVGVE